MPSDITLNDLRKVITATCEDDDICSVMLQLPLPEHLHEYEQMLLDIIPSIKDVDGLSTHSVGKLWSDKQCLHPCTAEGVMRALPNDLSGKKVAIINRSALVGKPLIKMVLDRNGTPVVCHSKSGNQSKVLRIASGCDYIITAVGKPFFITSGGFDWRGKTIIDVAINRHPDTNKLCGDIDIDSFKDIDCSITSVPGGIGTLTTSQLMLNVVKSFEMQYGSIDSLIRCFGTHK